MTGPLSNLSSLAPPSTDDLEMRTVEKACDALRAYIPANRSYIPEFYTIYSLWTTEFMYILCNQHSMLTVSVLPTTVV